MKKIRNARASKAIRAALLSIFAFLALSGCEVWGSRANPVDEGAENYEGFPTVGDPSYLRTALPPDGGTLTGQLVTVTKVLGAAAYEVRVAAAEADLDSSPLFSKDDCASNLVDLSGSGISNTTMYYWKARARATDGTWGSWSPTASFTVAWALEFTAMPTFDPPAGTYMSDQSVTLSCATTVAAIFYTTNGDTPTESSAQYTAPIAVAGDGRAMTIKAMALASGHIVSSVVTAVYIVDYAFTGLPLTMITVNGGTFNNGVSDVTVSSYSIGAYEITQAQYVTVVGNNPSLFIGDFDRPVERVTWFDTVEFCNLLSAREALQQAYMITDRIPSSGYPITSATVTMDMTKNGYRLPTEAEWEFAAGGGNATHNYAYSGSNAISEVAWYSGNSGIVPHIVGTKAPNELGLFDMSGNISEWCWDWSGVYPIGAQFNPTGPESGTHRIIRGGYYQNQAEQCTVASPVRPGAFVDVGYHALGFRVVRSVALSGTGLSISVVFDLGSADAMTMTVPETIAKGSALDFSVSESFDTYQWYLDGEPYATTISGSINTGPLSPGSHELALIVSKGGAYSSAACRFTVSN